MEACAAIVAREVPLPDKGSFVEDLRDYLSHLCSFFNSQLPRPVIAGLLAEAQCNAELARAFHERLLMQRRVVLHTILQRAVGRGELRPGLDLDVLMDMIHGALWYRTLILKAPLDEGFVQGLIAQVMAGCAAPKPPPDKPLPPA